MTFGERMRELAEQGLAASKELATKAGAKAQDLGERGALMLEVRRLEAQAQRLISRLGSAAYQAFAERGLDSVSKDMPEIRVILAELAEARAAIERKEAAARGRREPEGQ